MPPCAIGRGEGYKAFCQSPGQATISRAGDLVEVNSGGQVFFCFFNPRSYSEFSAEGLLVLKFHSSRLTTQSEQFANELTRHLGVCAPNCRILRETVSSFHENSPKELPSWHLTSCTAITQTLCLRHLASHAIEVKKEWPPYRMVRRLSPGCWKIPIPVRWSYFEGCGRGQLLESGWTPQLQPMRLPDLVTTW